MSSSIVCASLRQSTPQIANSTNAIHFIRRMRGGSQPSLIRCSDEKLHVVKFSNNQQGPNVLANEVIGTELLSFLGFPTPKWRPIFLSEDFINQNPDMWFETVSGRRLIKSGFHFGSEFLGDEISGKLYEWLPRSFSNRISNPHDYLGVYVFDVWANHCDHRQSLFTTEGEGISVKSTFIDNGHLFGGPNWNLQSRPGEALCLDSNLYSKEWTSEAIEAWITHFETRLYPMLSPVIHLVPPIWYSGNIVGLMECLRYRLENLRAIFSEERMNNRIAVTNQTRVNVNNAELPLHRFELSQYGNIKKRTTSCLAYGI